MGGEIEVRNIIHVKGRGGVAIGFVRQGKVRAGQQTRLPARDAAPSRVLTLAAVQPLHAREGEASALGLIFLEQWSLVELQSALVPGTRLHFEDALDPGTL